MKLLTTGLLFIAVSLLYQVHNSESVDKNTCMRGPSGNNGIPGIPGKPGFPGRCGRDGADGNQGKTGLRGPAGQTGLKGAAGQPGLSAGQPGLSSHANWKQCAWKRTDGKDKGLIQNCNFIKKHQNTALRVFYAGNLRIYRCNSCCKRWYLTFNGAECKGPLPIDGVFYMLTGAKQNIHRHRHIEGYCTNIHKGKVRVGFWVGNCPGYGNADAMTGWDSVSRIVIEEVPPPQA